MIHLFAALAEKERALISQRAKAALGAARARGRKLVNPNIEAARARAWLRSKPTPIGMRRANVLAIIEEIRKSGTTRVSR
jgi:DNA invertase Pin-like site-specific DNA recombinase